MSSDSQLDLKKKHALLRPHTRHKSMDYKGNLMESINLKRYIEHGNLEGVKSLMEKEKNLVKYQDNDSNTLLHTACEAGQVEIVKYLISKGLDVNAKNKFGWTPLMLSVYHGHLPVALVLCQQDSIDLSPKVPNSLRNFLHFMGRHWSPEVTPLIISKCGPELINAADHHGDSPLHRACIHGNAECVKLLVMCNANLNAKNKDGETPLHYASRAQSDEIVRILLESGANEGIKGKYGTYKDLVDKDGILVPNDPADDLPHNSDAPKKEEKEREKGVSLDEIKPVVAKEESSVAKEEDDVAGETEDQGEKSKRELERQNGGLLTVEVHPITLGIDIPKRENSTLSPPTLSPPTLSPPSLSPATSPPSTSPTFSPTFSPASPTTTSPTSPTPTSPESSTVTSPTTSRRKPLPTPPSASSIFPTPSIAAAITLPSTALPSSAPPTPKFLLEEGGSAFKRMITGGFGTVETLPANNTNNTNNSNNTNNTNNTSNTSNNNNSNRSKLTSSGEISNINANRSKLTASGEISIPSTSTTSGETVISPREGTGTIGEKVGKGISEVLGGVAMGIESGNLGGSLRGTIKKLVDGMLAGGDMLGDVGDSMSLLQKVVSATNFKEILISDIVPQIKGKLLNAKFPAIVGTADTPIGDIQYEVWKISLSSINIDNRNVTCDVTSEGLRVALKISAALKNFCWKYASHHLKDEGTANAEAQNVVCIFMLKVGVEDNRPKLMIKDTNVEMDQFTLDIHRSKARWLYNAVLGVLSNKVKTQIQTLMTAALAQQLAVLEGAFNEKVAVIWDRFKKKVTGEKEKEEEKGAGGNMLVAASESAEITYLREELMRLKVEIAKTNLEVVKAQMPPQKGTDIKCFYHRHALPDDPLIILVDTDIVGTLDELQTYIVEEFQYLDSHAFPAHTPKHPPPHSSHSHHKHRHCGSHSHPHPPPQSPTATPEKKEVVVTGVEWKIKDSEGDMVHVSRRTTLEQVVAHATGAPLLHGAWTAARRVSLAPDMAVNGLAGTTA